MCGIPVVKFRRGNLLLFKLAVCTECTFFMKKLAFQIAFILTNKIELFSIRLD